MNNRTNRHCNLQGHFKRKDPNAMKIDVAIMNEGLEHQNWWECYRNLTDKEWKKQQSKGCCFLYGRQGHMHHHCPKKNDRKGK
jgi:hypothetical protein